MEFISTYTLKIVIVIIIGFHFMVDLTRGRPTENKQTTDEIQTIMDKLGIKKPYAQLSRADLYLVLNELSKINENKIPSRPTGNLTIDEWTRQVWSEVEELKANHSELQQNHFELQQRVAKLGFESGLRFAREVATSLEQGYIEAWRQRPIQLYEEDYRPYQKGLIQSGHKNVHVLNEEALNTSNTMVADKIRDMFTYYDDIVDQKYLDEKLPRVIEEPFREDLENF